MHLLHSFNLKIAYGTTIEEEVHETVHMSSFKTAFDIPFHMQYKLPLYPGNKEKNCLFERFFKGFFITIDMKKFSLKQVEAWSPEQVASFVKTIPGCEKYAESFKQEVIDRIFSI